MNRQQGFTLVEVAMVVVIMGLLLGGVLKAQDLIANAKVKNLEVTFNSVAQAFYTYQERYSAYPGDDNYAGGKDDHTKGRFYELNSSANGDGDDNIEGKYNDYTDRESGKVWQHLRAAKLITGSSDDNQGPMNAYGGRIGIGMYTTLGIDTPPTMPGVFIGFTNIPSDVCIIFEGRSDGNPLNPQTRRVRATKADETRITDYPTDPPQLLNLLFLL